jgi:hypothetical protein
MCVGVMRDFITVEYRKSCNFCRPLSVSTSTGSGGSGGEVYTSPGGEDTYL